MLGGGGGGSGTNNLCYWCFRVFVLNYEKLTAHRLHDKSIYLKNCQPNVVCCREYLSPPFLLGFGNDHLIRVPHHGYEHVEKQYWYQNHENCEYCLAQERVVR